MIHVTLSCLCPPSEDALCYFKLFVDRVMMLHVRLSFFVLAESERYMLH